MDPSSSSSSYSNVYHPNPNWLAFSLSNHASPSPPSPPFPLFHPSPLANFLGGAPIAANLPPPRVEDYSSTAVVIPSSTVGELYDASNLKTIGASFHGFSGRHDARQLHRPQELQLAGSDGGRQQPAGKKAVNSFGQRTSIYRGVTRWTGRYEAHLWDNSFRREGQSRKGRQVYLGGYDKEDKAARAYDLAALKYWGPTTTTNFPVCNYEREVEEMKHVTKQEFVASLRRKSSGFSRGASIYRGVTRHHQHGRWQARIGRVAGNKDLYLGTFSTQEEAAEAYDIAAIKFRGLNAVTNFDMSRYDVKSIMSSILPIGGMSGKSGSSPESTNSNNGGSRSDDRDGLSSASTLSFMTTHLHHNQRPHNPSLAVEAQLSVLVPIKPNPSESWPMLSGHNHQNSRSIPFHHSSALFHDQNTNSDYFHGSIYLQQQQCDSASLPYGTLAANASNTNSIISTSHGHGSWKMIRPPPSPPPPPLHSCQTPICGME